MADAKSHEELQAELIRRAAADKDFRAALVRDPKAAIKEVLGLELPESVTVHVHEETATEAHLALPPISQLTDADLEAVAAGHTARAYWGGTQKHLHEIDGDLHE